MVDNFTICSYLSIYQEENRSLFVDQHTWLDSGLEVSEFNPSCAIMFTFKLKPLGKVSTPLSFNLCVNSITIVLLQGWPWNWITQEGWHAIKKKNQTKPNHQHIWLIVFQVSLIPQKILNKKNKWNSKKKSNWIWKYTYYIKFYIGV